MPELQVLEALPNICTFTASALQCFVVKVLEALPNICTFTASALQCFVVNVAAVLAVAVLCF